MDCQTGQRKFTVISFFFKNVLRNIVLLSLQEQYGFIYEALAEALHVRTKPIRLKDFEEIFISISKQDRDSGKSGLAKQYDVRTYCSICLLP